MRSADTDSHAQYTISQWRLINHLYNQYNIELPFEDILAKNFKKYLKRDDYVADVGAHSGFHTRSIADLVGPAGRVIAFEPLDYFAGLIKREFAGNGHVEVCSAAVSNFSGSARFTVARGTPEESGLKKKSQYIFPDLADLIETSVRVVKLDDVLSGWPKLDYIKIDVEGAELDVLEGGESIVTRFRPIISFECGNSGYGQYGKSLLDFERYSVSHQMAIFDILGNNLTLHSLFNSVADRAHTWDFYFVPQEKVDFFEGALRHSFLP